MLAEREKSAIHEGYAGYAVMEIRRRFTNGSQRYLEYAQAVCTVGRSTASRGHRGECLEFLLRNNLFYESHYPTRFASRVGYGIDWTLHL